MIRSFRNKGLERFHRTGNTSGIQSAPGKRLRLILSNLDMAQSPDDMDLPGLRLHRLRGARTGFWAAAVNANWRLTFRFTGRDVELVDYEDYH